MQTITFQPHSYSWRQHYLNDADAENNGLTLCKQYAAVYRHDIDENWVVGSLSSMPIVFNFQTHIIFVNLDIPNKSVKDKSIVLLSCLIFLRHKWSSCYPLSSSVATSSRLLPKYCHPQSFVLVIVFALWQPIQEDFGTGFFNQRHQINGD